MFLNLRKVLGRGHLIRVSVEFIGKLHQLVDDVEVHDTVLHEELRVDVDELDEILTDVLGVGLCEALQSF